MPSSKAREVLDQIDRDRAALLRSVERIDAVLLDERPSPDSWSISDVLHHLALTEEAAAKLLSRMLEKAREQQLPPDPDPNGSVLDSIAAVVAGADRARASAPDRVAPRSHVAAADAIARLGASRKSLAASLAALSDYDCSRLTHPHPFFGELDVYQWVLVTGWHEQRHRKQIVRVRAEMARRR